MNRLIRLAIRKGFRRGVMQGNRPWLIAGSVALGVRVLQKMATNEPKVVYSEELKPGQAVVITHEAPS
jgi:hypothetical protein